MEFRIINDSDRQAVKDYIDALPSGKIYTAVIVRKQAKRTLSQNRLYWLYIACICQETGNDKDTIHEFLRGKFLGIEERTIGNEQVTSIKSTKGLNTVQFGNYIDRIVTWAAMELGVVLPDPKESYFEQFYEAYKNFI